MAKAKAEVNKSEEIRTIFKTTPTASAKEVVATLKAKGIDVSENLVYGVKKKMKPGKKKTPKATAKAAAPVVAPSSEKSVNKSEEIRAVFTATPTASAKEVVATLKAKGISVSENHVYGVKKTLGKKKPGRKPKAMATVKVALTKAVPSSNGVLGVGASITVAKAAAEKVGGWSALKEIVDALA